MKDKTKKVLKFTIQLIVSTALLVFLFWKFDFSTLLENWRSYNWFLLIVLVLLFFVTQFINSLKWKLLLPKNNKLPVFQLFQFNIFGYFFNNFLPSGIGGDAYKIYAIHKKGSVDSFASVLINRLWGLATLFAIFVIAGAIAYQSFDGLTQKFYLIFIATLSILIVLFLILNKWIIRILRKIKKIDKIIGQLQSYFSEVNYDFKKIIIVTIYSFLVQSFSIISNMVIFRVVNQPISFFQGALIFSVISVVRMIPITLNGWGISENAYLYLTKEIMNLQVDSIVAFIPRISQFIVSIIAGIWFLFYTIKKKIKKRNERKEEEGKNG